MALGSFLGGRGNRKEYWVAFVAVMVVSFVADLIGPDISVGMSVPSLWFMVRRLHDINKTGWWSLAIAFGPFVLLLLTPFFAFPLLLVAAALIALVWTVWLGVIPGDPHVNRFGPPPGRPDLAETFG